MQDCTRKLDKAILNSNLDYTLVSTCLCTHFFFPPSCLCICPTAAAEMSIAIETRLESDVNWAGDWFVD